MSYREEDRKLEYTVEQRKSMMMEATALLERAVGLMTINVPIYSAIIMNSKCKIIPTRGDSTETMFACMTSQGKYIIQAYDEFVLSHSASIPNLVYVLMHECMHVMAGHLYINMSKYNMNLLAMALDHCINVDLNKQFSNGRLASLSLDLDSLKPLIITELQSKNMTEHEVYEWLLDNTESITITGDVDGDTDGNSAGGGQDRQQSIKVDVDGSKGVVNIINQQSEEARAKGSTAVANMNSQAKTIMDACKKGSGTIYSEYLSGLVDVEVDPARLLKNIVDNCVGKGSAYRSTFMRRNLRTKKMGFRTPVRSKSQVVVPNTHAVVLRDVSGSTSDMQNAFNTILLKVIIPSFDTTHIIQHASAIIRPILKMSRSNDVEGNVESISKLYGTGGTSHLDCFDYIDDIYLGRDVGKYEEGSIDRVKNGGNKSDRNTKDRKSKLSIVVMMTDYESDIEEIWDRYAWTQDSTIVTKIIMASSDRSAVAGWVDRDPIKYKAKLK